MGRNKKGSITLGDMLGQTAESKMEKFVDTMPTIIQTHLITCKNWAKTTKKAKELEHIIRKCDPPAAALPTLTPFKPFKGARPKQTKTRGSEKGKQPLTKAKTSSSTHTRRTIHL